MRLDYHYIENYHRELSAASRKRFCFERWQYKCFDPINSAATFLFSTFHHCAGIDLKVKLINSKYDWFNYLYIKMQNLDKWYHER